MAMLLVAAMVAVLAPQWVQGAFSFDTVPVFIETSNVSGVFDAEALATIVRAQLFVIEKGYDNVNSSFYAETKAKDLAAQLRSMNPNLTLVFYYNSNLDLSDYQLHATMQAHAPGWWLVDSEDKPVICHQDARAIPPFPYLELYVYNHSVPGVRDAWVNECIGMLDAYDGCMVDRWDRDPKTTPPVPAAELRQWSADRDLATSALSAAMKARKRLLIGDVASNDTDMASYPSWGYNLVSGLKSLQTVVKNGRGMLASQRVNCTQEEFTSQLAAFLIGCGPNTYFGAGSWTVDHTHRLGLKWWPEYDYPLGEPLSDAVSLDSHTLFRQFAKGVNVTFDLSTATGNITWG